MNKPWEEYGPWNTRNLMCETVWCKDKSHFSGLHCLEANEIKRKMINK